MPLIKSAIKRMKQTAKRRARNVAIKRDIKGAVKAFFANPSAETLSAAQSELDTAVKKKLLKKNTVSRRKAQLAKAAKEAGVKLGSSKKKTADEAPAKKPAAKKTTTAKADTKKKTAETKKPKKTEEK
ncbi:MAG TPA: 30S ribosomal protein S20 [Verrucomicrobiae bacterium]|nr:30S ribosomal protein S20 [Verrucomicrobiae bacterium]